VGSFRGVRPERERRVLLWRKKMEERGGTGGKGARAQNKEMRGKK